MSKPVMQDGAEQKYHLRALLAAIIRQCIDDIKQAEPSPEKWTDARQFKQKYDSWLENRRSARTFLLSNDAEEMLTYLGMNYKRCITNLGDILNAEPTAAVVPGVPAA